VWSRIPKFQQTLQNYAEKKHVSYPLQFDLIESHDALVRAFDETPKPEILIADPPEIPKESWEFLFQKQPIRWIQSTWAGVEKAFRTVQSLPDLDPNSLKGIILTKKGGFGPHMLEYALQHMLNLERNYTVLRNAQQEKGWASANYKYRTLQACTIGIMGFGDIGEHVAKGLKQSFSMRVHVLRRSSSNSNQNVDQFFTTTDIDAFLGSGLDYILNTMPSTNETKGLLNDEKLRLCANHKPCFINVGRGDLISENEIIKALDNGWVSHAVLDVFEQEPLPSESKLWNREDVVITPHVSAISFSEETAKVFYENLERFKNNLPLNYVASWSGGY
jgi:phosphoglycerate dehydrogenase-like enzyme